MSFRSKSSQLSGKQVVDCPLLAMISPHSTFAQFIFETNNHKWSLIEGSFCIQFIDFPIETNENIYGIDRHKSDSSRNKIKKIALRPI